MNFDLKDMQTYTICMIGGASVALISFALYSLKGGKMKIPASIGIGLSCLVFGVGAGVILLSNFGYSWDNKRAEEANAARQKGGFGPGGMGPGGMGPGGMGFGGKGKDGGSGGESRGPSPKNQLVSLVTKLSALTEKPLVVTLDADRKKKIGEQIKDLGSLETISDDEAKKRLDDLLRVLKDDRKTLEAAGFNWPGTTGAGNRGKDVPNPFTSEPNSKALKELQKHVEAK